MALKISSILLAATVTLTPLGVAAGQVPLFPDPAMLIDQANEEYAAFFSRTDWKLKSVEIAGVERAARYQSSTLLLPPAVIRTGLYSWTVVYRVRDRYRATGQSLYACRTTAIAIRHRLLDGVWKWGKSVRLNYAFDRSDEPCKEHAQAASKRASGQL